MPCALQAFIYLASIQLLLSAAPSSAVAGACGTVAGLLYRLNVLGLQRLRLPSPLVDLFTSTVGRLLGPAVPQVFVTPAAAQQQQAGAAGYQQVGGHHGQMPQHGAAARGGAVEPSPEALRQLVAMGFDESSAARALQQTGNNVEAALQYLL